MYKLFLSLVMTFCTMFSWAEDVDSIASAQNNQNVCPQIVEKESNSYLHGDINYDGIVNVNDIAALAEIILNGEEKKSNSYLHGDINYDGAVNINDIAALAEIILNGEEGDEGGEGGEPQVYLTCIDNNHPHVIALGLPSGTKWCCCNVGATTPGDYGGYYAWGETSEKSYYTWDTYAYYNSNTGSYTNIGSDIAGSEYDVAHVRMGGSWRMPSKEQQQELIQNCTCKWTVGGTFVTGKNGGQIFLPAAGYRYYGVPGGAGSSGRYWSSSFYPGDGDAYELYFDSGYFGEGKWNWYGGNRDYGRSVRAVCP